VLGWRFSGLIYKVVRDNSELAWLWAHEKAAAVVELHLGWEVI
jgi:hypothetical protein